MRKLKLQVQVSLDGFMAAGPNDEQLWVTWAWEEIRPHVLALADSTDTILIGRKLAVDYIPYWEGVFENPADPMHEVAARIVPARKVVFTQTLEKSEWARTELARGDLALEVSRLKAESGKDIVAYGGSSFVQALVATGLVDEFHIFVNPVALGKGDPVFSALPAHRQLLLDNVVRYPSGIVLLQYAPRPQ